MMYFIGVTAFAAGVAFGVAATLIYWPWPLARPMP
jgi:hypothetical protein